MKNTTIVLLLIISLFSPIAAHAAGNPALEGLETLRRGFAEVSDFTAEITQEKQLSLMKQKMVSKGVVRFKKPGIFFMELYPPHASRLRLQNNSLTVRLPKEGVTDRITLPPEEGLERWFAYLARPVTALPEGVDVRGERQGDLWSLRILPGGKGGVKELRLVFDREGRIRRLAIEERNSDRTVIRFHNMRRNVGLTERDFQVE
ncbi:MAG TPA: outer membrane lipoprotein carrier protein LolA [Geobacteraceae bacterium]